MARVTNIFSAHWVGSAGFGTFKQLGGQTVVSQKSLGPTNEPSDIQIGNERSMATLVEIGRTTKFTIYKGFNELKVKNDPNKCRNTAWGAFIGENRKYDNGVFTYTTPDDPTFNPDMLIAAKGTIEPTEMTSVTGDVSAQELALTWPASAGGVGQGTYDLLWIVVYNETTDIWGVVPAADLIAYRIDGTIGTLDTPVPFIITDTVRVYTFFQGQTTADYPTNPLVFTGKESDSTNMVATLSA